MPQLDPQLISVLIEAVSGSILIIDNQQQILNVNSETETMFGYKKDELLHKNFNLLIPSYFQKNIGCYFKVPLNIEKRQKIEKASGVFGKKKNGDLIAIELELNPFVIDNTDYIMVLLKEVSEKNELEKSFMLKSRALESAGNGIIITDALKEDNPIIYCNIAFQKLTGYPIQDILGHNCRFLQGVDRNQKSFKILREAIKKGESCQITVRNYKKDGTLFWNDLYIMPIINEKGILTNFIGIQNDVTKRKKAESERNHFATIFHESLNEIYVFDADTFKFLNANYGAQRNSGYTLKELQNKTPLDLKTQLTEREYLERVNLLKSAKVEKIEFETIHQRKDGSTYPVEVHLQLSNLGDRPVFIAIILDITERKNYTKELENKVEERTAQLKLALSKEKGLNKLKTQFLSLVSHEFKTPLSGILTSALLLSKYKTSKDQLKRDKHIKIIADKVHYLNAILNDFLSLERLETGKVNYSFNHFKLSKVLDDVIYNANMLLKEGQHIHYPDNISDLSLCQDEKIIGLILTNLVNNAVKYSLEHTLISIRVEQRKDHTVIQVIDQGIGIPLKDQKSIFERYFRADNVVTIQGTGIGLNIVKNHLENLGGSIYFESKENEGTVFTITIPNIIGA